MMKQQEKSLGELLRQAGKITSRQIQVALGEQKKSHEPIGKILVRLGFVEERDILQVMEGMMVLTFQVEGESYGIETFRVKEVLKYSPLEAPQASPGTLEGSLWDGHSILRGRRFPVLSYRRFLGLGRPANPKGTWFIVLEVKSSAFVLWVDKVLEVTRMKINQIEPCPPHLFGKRNELYYCLGKIRDSYYSILNPDKLFGGELSLPAAEGEDPPGPAAPKALGPELRKG